MIDRAEKGTVMRSDEGKTSSGLGVKKDFSSKRKVSAKKDDMAERIKAKGMPYTQSTQSGKFDEGRGEKAKMWGPSPSFSRSGGMPYSMWGSSPKVAGARKNSLGRSAMDASKREAE